MSPHQALIADMLAAFVRENDLSRMGGQPGSGYSRCVLCERVVREQGNAIETLPHHPNCPVISFRKRCEELR